MSAKMSPFSPRTGREEQERSLEMAAGQFFPRTLGPRCQRALSMSPGPRALGEDTGGAGGVGDSRSPHGRLKDPTLMTRVLSS
jgi:hypothetical protein